MATAGREHLLIPEWPAPQSVRACFTTRQGGVSGPPWSSFNLAEHVGDEPAAIAQNRARLRSLTGLATEPCWMKQVHGSRVHRLHHQQAGVCADALITRQRGIACAVLVADCVPVLLCADDGAEVAAVHAGWRGLDADIIANAVAAFEAPAQRLVAWIGPCIGADAYLVDEQLRARFVALRATYAQYFRARGAKWQMDLRGLAEFQLRIAGVRRIGVSPHCVYAERERFFSYRRDRETGRMAALIWLGNP